MPFQPTYQPQYYVQPVPVVAMQTSGSRKAFWLGLIGGIIGVIIAIGFAALGSLADAFGVASGSIYVIALLILIFSIMGMAGCFLESHKLVGGVLMMVAGIAMFIFVVWLGALTAILFGIGGLLMISDWVKEDKTQAPKYMQVPMQPAYMPQLSQTVAPSNQQAPPQSQAQNQK